MERRFGPVSKMSRQDALFLVHILTGGMASIPFGSHNSECRISGPGGVVMWSANISIGEGVNEARRKAVICAAVDLAGEGVRYDDESDMVVDERPVAVGVVESPVTTGIRFSLSVVKDGEHLDPMRVWAREDYRGEWLWGVEEIGIEGRASDQSDAVHRIHDAVSSWWATFETFEVDGIPQDPSSCATQER